MDSDHFTFILLNTQGYPLTVTFVISLLISALLLYMSALLLGVDAALQSLSIADKDELKDIKSDKNDSIQSLLEKINETQVGVSIWSNALLIVSVVLCYYAFDVINTFDNSLINLFVVGGVLLVFIIVCELFPKVYAKADPIRFLEKTLPFIYVINKITYPLARLVVKVIDYSDFQSHKKVNDVSVDDLSKALELTSDNLSEEKDMLEGIINLYNKTAAEIMTPRMDIASIDISDGFDKVLAYVVEVEYSRIPVFENNADNIKGVLYIKDLLPYLDKKEDFEWQNLIRDAFFVPETKKIDDLLDEFRANKNHIAVVVDEYGGTSGIVTLEDILEEIVGEINDEYDDEEEVKYICQDDGSYVFIGKILLTDFFRITNVDSKLFDDLEGEMDTLAGLILELKGDFPQLNEVIEYGNCKFTILEMDNKRILKIRLEILKD
ncbi:putative hemolysin [Dysgonomonadaceae bacterium PH5-43]|nr:putative hemolysin [Dysgonomonadaceae bacterium PH5-43]